MQGRPYPVPEPGVKPPSRAARAGGDRVLLKIYPGVGVR
jgi:hypothetical protein